MKDFNGIKEEIPIEQVITKTEKIALMEEQVKVQEQSDLLRTENRSLKSQLGIAVAKTDDYDALATRNGNLTVKVETLENAAMQHQNELSSAAEDLASTRKRARIFEVCKLALDSYMGTEGAQKNPQSIALAISTIQRAVNELYGEETPSLNLPRVTGVNFAEVVHNINRRLDERDGGSPVRHGPL